MSRIIRTVAAVATAGFLAGGLYCVISMRNEAKRNDDIRRNELGINTSIEKNKKLN
jgi:hypothetical protein